LVVVFAQIFALIVSVFSLKKKSVSISGFACMLVISSIFIWNNGLGALIVLFSMFLSSSLITKYKHEFKAQLTDKVLKKSGPRDAIQAISNLGMASLCFVLYCFSKESVYLLAMACSVAASNADSWASEIGVLSKSKPVLITNFKECKPGISGGVTWLGTIAGLFGSMFIALITCLLKNEIGIDLEFLYLFLIVSVFGFIGIFVDSLLGATVQIIYTDNVGDETENNQNAIIKSRGVEWINNDMVNFLTTLIIAILVLIVF
jgi:uncharacterized protein (TIGR00297 family)